MSHAGQRIRDAAMDGDFVRAALLWRRDSAEIEWTELPELIAAVRQSAAEARSHAWVAKAYRPG